MRFKKGDRVSTTLSSGNSYDGTVVGRVLLKRLILVTFDEFPNVTGVPFYKRELRKIT